MPRPDPKLIPPHHKHAIDLWVDHALHPGDGLTAFLENNLKEAVVRCDAPTLDALEHITAYLIWKVPAECWGSKAKVAAWRGTTAEVL